MLSLSSKRTHSISRRGLSQLVYWVIHILPQFQSLTNINAQSNQSTGQLIHAEESGLLMHKKSYSNTGSSKILQENAETANQSFHKTHLSES